METIPSTPAEPLETSPALPPSVHVRAFATWITIFPLVAIGMTLMATLTESWHPIVRALVLTLVVVPLAVYVVVPRVLALISRAGRSR